MQLYYITDRTQFAGSEAERRRLLLQRIAEAAQNDIDFIQLREKDLSVRELELLAREAVGVVRAQGSRTRILINSRIDVALSCQADGVHLTSTDIPASEARAIAAAAHRTSTSPRREFLVAVSCHTPSEVRLAESHGADFCVLAPIFEKIGAPNKSLGLPVLRESALHNVPLDRRVEAGDNRAHLKVFALGGVNLENARQCFEAGASGIAGIRLFQFGDLADTVRLLRAIH